MEKILEKIHNSTLKFLEPLRPEETYSRIVQEAIKLVAGQSGVIMIKEGVNFRPVFATTKRLMSFKPRSKGFVYKAFKRRKAFVIYPDDYGQLYPDMLKKGINSGIFLPLSYKHKSYGVLVVQSKKNQSFTMKELSILELFGSLASLAIRKTQLYNEARENSILKDRFLSIAAHELRTPLTSMNGYIQLLHKRLNKRDDHESQWTSSLLQESNRLATLIEEVLDINKINAGKLQLNLQECSLSDIIDAAIEKLRLSYPEHQVQKTYKVKKTHIICDSSKMTTVFYNILENAAKFSPDHEKINVILTSFKDDYIIQIADKGGGIAVKDMDHIYDIFYKAENVEQDGMGFGLFIAKKVIHAHKGDIQIDSQINKGTLVTISIPKYRE